MPPQAHRDDPMQPKIQQIQTPAFSRPYEFKRLGRLDPRRKTCRKEVLEKDELLAPLAQEL